ncbi:MAG TPA: hypothetical protein VFX53_16170, partial [Pedococcus sp.]|nr:hypothetical protein [Pedococcus sp.]
RTGLPVRSDSSIGSRTTAQSESGWCQVRARAARTAAGRAEARRAYAGWPPSGGHPAYAVVVRGQIPTALRSGSIAK